MYILIKLNFFCSFNIFFFFREAFLTKMKYNHDLLKKKISVAICAISSFCHNFLNLSIISELFAYCILAFGLLGSNLALFFSYSGVIIIWSFFLCCYSLCGGIYYSKGIRVTNSLLFFFFFAGVQEVIILQ